MIIDMHNKQHASIGYKCKCKINGESIPALTYYVDDAAGILRHYEAKSNGAPLIIKDENGNDTIASHEIYGKITIEPPEGMDREVLQSILDTPPTDDEEEVDDN